MSFQASNRRYFDFGAPRLIDNCRRFSEIKVDRTEVISRFKRFSDNQSKIFEDRTDPNRDSDIFNHFPRHFTSSFLDSLLPSYNKNNPSCSPRQDRSAQLSSLRDGTELEYSWRGEYWKRHFRKDSFLNRSFEMWVNNTTIVVVFHEPHSNLLSF